MRDGAIVYEPVSQLSDLPIGWTDRQEPGRYRLERRDDAALFGFTVGPQAWKRFLHPPAETLWTMRRGEDGVTVESPADIAPKFAFIGVRACELHAIAIQDACWRRGLMRKRLMRRAGRCLHRRRQLRAGGRRHAFASRCRPGRRPTADSISR